MSDEYMAHLKMSQMDWKNNPTDYINRPISSPSTTVTPTLQLYPAVLDALKKVEAIGFDISTKPQAQMLLRFLADRSVFGAIQDMTPEEYIQVFSQHVLGMSPNTPEPTPSDNQEVQMSVGDVTDPGMAKQSIRRLFAQFTKQDMTELLQILMDVGFEMNNPEWGQMVLKQLSESKSPASPLAAQMVPLADDKIQWESLVADAGGAMLDQITPSDKEFNPVKEIEYAPNEIYSPEEMLMDEDHDEPDLDIEPQLEPVKTPPQGIPAQAPTAPAQAMPAMPTKTQGQGAQATSKQLQETVSKFEDLKKAIPAGVKALNWGDNSGVKIKTKDGRGSDVAKGGMLLKNYGTTEDGIVVGVAPGNRLYVRVPPDLGTSEWDPASEDIRVSMHDRKWKPEGY